MEATEIPVLVTREQMAEYLSVSLNQIDRMNREKRLPKPVRLGPRMTRWRRDDFIAWLDEGCPKRDEA